LEDEALPYNDTLLYRSPRKDGSKSGRVYDALRSAIITLKLQPGAQIDKAEICTRLQVSRQPLSEALARLAEERLVTVEPQKGSYVTRIRMNDVVEAAFVREALEVATVARGLGFSHTVAVLHDGEGSLAPLSDTQKAVYAKLLNEGGSIAHKINYHAFQKNLMDAKPNDWRCRAGGRYLYICEFGLVHRCSQQRGTPGTPLLSYTRADVAREFDTVKDCAPFCTLSCVHQASFFDGWRAPQRRHDPQPVPA